MARARAAVVAELRAQFTSGGTELETPVLLAEAPGRWHVLL